MRNALLGLAVLFAVGCGHENVPKEKYFSGQPVEHWLKEAKSADPKARKKAAEVLGNVGPAHKGALPALAEALKDRDPKVRDAAVLGLSKNGPASASALPALEETLRDSDATVRAHARAAIQQIKGG
jgi:HEAT repeat protein